MGLFAWRGAVPNAEVAAARAAAGAAYLDGKLGADWDRVIDLERLDIGSPICCVLAQLGWEGHMILLSPGWAVAYGLSCGGLADCAYLVFRPRTLRRSFELLTEAWKALLAERRRQRAEGRQPPAPVVAGPADGEVPAVGAWEERGPVVEWPKGRARRRRSRETVGA